MKGPLWQTKHERYPSLYCVCGFEASDLLLPEEKARHNTRHRDYVTGKKLGKTFPRERIGSDNIVCVPGEETGIVSRAVYFLARDFNRLCGFDFVMWPYLGETPMEPEDRAYLYVEAGFAVGLLLGQTEARFSDMDEPIPAFVRAVYTAGGHQRKGIARSLALRFARDLGVEPTALVWDGPVTAGGAALVKSISGPDAMVAGGGAS